MLKKSKALSVPSSLNSLGKFSSLCFQCQLNITLSFRSQYFFLEFTLFLFKTCLSFRVDFLFTENKAMVKCCLFLTSYLGDSCQFNLILKLSLSRFFWYQPFSALRNLRVSGSTSTSQKINMSSYICFLY